MDVITLCHILDMIFFIFIVAVFFCYALTPVRSRKLTFWLCVLIMSPDILFMAANYNKIFLFHWIVMALPLLFLFSDPVQRKVACYILTYFLCCLCEIIGATILCTILSIQNGRLITAFSLNGSQSFLYLLCTIAVTLLLLWRLSPFLKKLLDYIDGISVIFIGGPVIFYILTQAIMTVTDFPLWGFLPVFLLSYILLHRGLIIIRRHEFRRQQLKSQKRLIEEQLSYSRELEKEYQQLRKWNHDIGNHFQALAFLLESGKYEESKNYIRTLLEKES